MKILLLSDEFPPDGSGGDAAVVANLARGFMTAGHEVRLAVATKSPELAGKGMWEGIPIVRIYASYHPRWLPWLGLYNRKAVRQVRQILKDFKPDVVNAHTITRYLSL